MAKTVDDVLQALGTEPKGTTPAGDFVIDGDTFIQPDDTRIRLEGVDAPETPKLIDGQFRPGDPGGNEATRILEELLARNPNATVELTGDETYNRQVGRVVDADGNDVLSEDLVGTGAARPTRFSDQRQINAESTALFRDLGLFEAIDDPVQRQMFDRMKEAVATDQAVTRFDPTDTRRAPVTDSVGTIGGSLSRGTDELQATLYAAANAVGDVLAVDGIAEWGEEGMRRNMFEAALHPAEVGSYENIEDLSTLGTWVLEVIGEQLPNVASLLTGAGVTAVAARAAVGKSLLKVAERDVLKRYGGRQFMGSATPTGIRNLARREAAALRPAALKRATRRGVAAGTFGASYPLGVGEVQRELKAAGIDAPGTALIAGVPIAALDTASFGVALSQFFKNIPQTASADLLSSVARGFGIGAGESALAEIPTEVAQELISITAHAYEDPSFEIFTPENGKRLIEAGLAAGVVSTAMGGTGGIVSGARSSLKARDVLKNLKARDPATEDFNPNEEAPSPAQGGDPTGGRTAAAGGPQSPAHRGAEGPDQVRSDPAQDQAELELARARRKAKRAPKPKPAVEEAPTPPKGRAANYTEPTEGSTAPASDADAVSLDEALEQGLTPSTENPDENVATYEVSESRAAGLMERLFPGTQRRKEGGRHVLEEDLGPKPLRSDTATDARDVRAALAKVFDDGVRTANKRVLLENRNPNIYKPGAGKPPTKARANLQQIAYLGATIDGRALGANPSRKALRDSLATGMSYLAELGFTPPPAPLNTAEARQRKINELSIPGGKYNAVFDLPLDTVVHKNGTTLGDLTNVGNKINETAARADEAAREAEDAAGTARAFDDWLNTARREIKREEARIRKETGKEPSYPRLMAIKKTMDGEIEAMRNAYVIRSAKGLEPQASMAKRFGDRTRELRAAYGALLAGYRAFLESGGSESLDNLSAQRDKLKEGAEDAWRAFNKAKARLNDEKAALEHAGFTVNYDGDTTFDRQQLIDDDEEVASYEDRIEAEEAELRKQSNKARSAGAKGKRLSNEELEARAEAIEAFQSQQQVTDWLPGRIKLGEIATSILEHIGVKTRSILISETTIPKLVGALRARSELKRRRAMRVKSVAGREAALRDAEVDKVKADELDRVLEEQPTGRIIYNDMFQDSTQRVPIIFISDKLKGRRRRFTVLAHELGHLVQRATFDQASPKIKELLRQELGGDASIPVEQDVQFSENFANQLLRWVYAREKPRGLVEQFFHKAVKQLRAMWNALRKKGLNESFAAFMDALVAVRSPAKLTTATIKPYRRGEAPGASHVVQDAEGNAPKTALGRAFLAEAENFVHSPFLPKYDGLTNADFTEGLNRGIDDTVRAGASVVRKGAARITKTKVGAVVEEVLSSARATTSSLFTVLGKSSDSYLRSIGLDDIANHFRHRPDATGERTVESIGIETRRRSGRWEVRISRLAERMPKSTPWSAWFTKRKGDVTSDAEYKAATDELQNQVPDAELKTDLAKEVRKYYSDLFDYLTNDLGIMMERRADYSPMMIDIVKWRENEAEVKRVLYNSGVYESESIADIVYDEIARSDGMLMPDSDELVSPSFRNSESRNWDRDMYIALRPYMVDDIVGLMSFYTHAAIRRGVVEKRWGKLRHRKDNDGVEHDFIDPLYKLNEDLNARLSRGGITQAEFDRVTNVIIPSYFGQLGANIDPRVRRFNSFMVMYQNLRLLSMAVFSSFVDAGQLSIRSGNMLEAWKQIVQIIKMSSHDRQQAYDMASYLGAIRDDITEHVLNDQLESQYLTPSAKKINEGFFKLIGMHQWTNLTRVMAMRAGIDFITRHANNDSAKSKQYMRELGITREEANAWLREYETNRVTAMHAEGHANVQAALHQFIDESIVRPDATMRPAWASDPRYMLFWHLKSFMWGLHETVLRRVWSQSKDAEGFARALPFVMLAAALLPFAAAGYELRQQVKWLGDPPSGGGKEGSEYFWEILQRSGMLGVMQLYVDLGESEKFDRFALLSLAGPSVSQLEEFFTRDLDYFARRATPVLAQSPGLVRALSGGE